MRFLLTLVIILVLAWLAATVPLGKHTLVGHVRAIWHSEQVRDLKEGVEEKAGPTAERVKRGVKSGYDEMKRDDPGTGSNAPVQPAPPPAPAPAPQPAAP